MILSKFLILVSYLANHKLFSNISKVLDPLNNISILYLKKNNYHRFVANGTNKHLCIIKYSSLEVAITVLANLNGIDIDGKYLFLIKN